MRIVFTLCVAIVLLGIPKANAEQYGIAQSSSSWSTNHNQPDRTDGIDTAAVTLVKLIAGPDQGVPVLLWSDDSSQGFPGSGSGQFSVGAKFDAKVRGEDGSVINIHAETKDGETGWVTIADVEYDLADGHLFLIKTRGTKPRIAQLSVDVKKVSSRFGMNGLIKFARSNSKIVSFWKDAEPAGKDTQPVESDS